MIITREKIIYNSVPACVFFFGIWYFCIRILGTNLEYIPGDKGDSRFINFLLEHGNAWLNGKSNSFWTAGFMYPFQNTIALSDNMLGGLPFYVPWRCLGFSPETSYQLWWIVVCALNYWCCYWAIKKLYNNKIIGAVLAWVFAFSIYNLGQLNYMQMIMRFPVPIAFYACIQIVTKHSIKHLLLYCAALVYQFYCVPYTGIYLFYFSLLFLFVYLIITKQLKSLTVNYFNKKNILKTIGILLATFSLIIFILLPYHFMSKIVGLQLYGEVLPNLPKWHSYLLPHESSIPWRFLFEINKSHYSQWWLMYMFPGLIVLGVIIFSIIYFFYILLKKIYINTLLKSLIITTFIITLLHLNFGNGFSFYALIFKLPGINSMRVLNRFLHVELFILLVILMHFLKLFNIKIIFVFMLLIFLDNSFNADKVIRESKKQLIQRKEELVTKIKYYDFSNKLALALVDTTTPPYISHLDMMLASEQVGIKTINGYSSYCPDAFGEYFLKCSKQGLNKWLYNQNINEKSVLIIERK